MREGEAAMPGSVRLVPGGFWPVIARDLCFEAGGARRVDGLNFRLEPGPVTAVMGPNGAGKSLLLRLLAGLIAPTSGAVTYGDAAGPEPGQIAMVFQKPVLLRRSVIANLKHALKAYGVPRSDRVERLAELLALASLDGMENRPARLLSGGEQQRLAMARALAANPRLLLLDEPTASLDPHATVTIEALITDAARRGVKVVIVTHDTGQARRLADDIVFMHAGRITERTAADVFFDAPQSSEARDFREGRLLLNTD